MTVKAYVDRIAVVAAGQVVARHARSYERGAMVLDPLHYLTTLSRKPACLDHAPVYRDWMLPPAFAELRRSLEIRHGPFAGSRQFIRVLLLLGDHPQERVERAILSPAAGEAPSADAIILRVHRLRDKERSRMADVPDAPVESPPRTDRDPRPHAGPEPVQPIPIPRRTIRCPTLRPSCSSRT